MDFKKIFLDLNHLLDRKIKLSIFLLILLLFLVSIFELLSLATIPAYISYIISGELSYLNFTEVNFFKFENNNLNLFYISLVVILFSIKALFLFFANYYEVNVIKNIKIKICSLLMQTYIIKEYMFFVDNNSSILSRNLINETNNSVSLIQSLITIFKELMLLIVIFFLVFFYNPLLSSLILIILIIGSIIFYLFTFKILKKNSQKRLESAGKVFKIINQSMGFIKDIKIFQKENFFFTHYQKNLQMLESKLAIHELLARIPKIFFELLGVTLIMAILFFSTTGNQSKTELISILPFLALVSACIIKLLPSFKSISGSLTHIVAYSNSLFLLTSQIQKSFKLNEKILPQITDVSSPNILELDKINFHYQNDSKTLINIDLNLKSKSIIGLIGRSGSGKSTLINIILGLFMPSSGTIKFKSNKNRNTFDNKTISYVPQDILILDDTLKKNIAFGIEDEKIDEARIVEVIEKSGLLNFYQKNQSSLDISLGESGVKISGGEKQRIGIARALYFNPEILILDESTSSLDNYTESLILNEISRIKGSISIIIISHKLSTLKICDDVYYLKNGKIHDVDNLKNLEKKYPELNIEKN